MIEKVTDKVIISGDVIEIYKYQKGYLKGYENDEALGGRKSNYESENYAEHRKQVLSRAKRDLRRLINANVNRYGDQFTSKFITLTFGENITDISVANAEFRKFIKKLNYLIYGTKKQNLKYSVVPEFQSRGAVHYHIIIYNMPYVKQNIIQDVWGNGFVFINKIDNIDNVGAYIAEYLGDSNKKQGREEEDDRLKGKKSYFNSRGLFKPIEITDKRKVEALAQALPIDNKTYEARFENEHLGAISYTQYNIKRCITK